MGLPLMELSETTLRSSSTSAELRCCASRSWTFWFIYWPNILSCVLSQVMQRSKMPPSCRIRPFWSECFQHRCWTSKPNSGFLGAVKPPAGWTNVTLKNAGGWTWLNNLCQRQRRTVKMLQTGNYSLVLLVQLVLLAYDLFVNSFSELLRGAPVIQLVLFMWVTKQHAQRTYN